MSETFTKTLNLNSSDNKEAVKELNATEGLEADELIFYHSLRNDMDLLKKNPSEVSVSIILAYSRSLR